MRPNSRLQEIGTFSFEIEADDINKGHLFFYLGTHVQIYIRNRYFFVQLLGNHMLLTPKIDLPEGIIPPRLVGVLTRSRDNRIFQGLITNIERLESPLDSPLEFRVHVAVSEFKA